MKTLQQRDYDAIVVGAGPNGLAAAIALQRAGIRVLLVEAKSTVGGGLRSSELTLPGFMHDNCSAVHPMALASPFFNQLPLADFGLRFIEPTYAAAHPFDNGNASVLHSSLDITAASLGEDAKSYLHLMSPIVNSWSELSREILAPLHFPKHPGSFTSFGLKAIRPALALARLFKTTGARGLLAGMAAHSMLPLNKLTTSAVALVLLACGHTRGWPIVKGGSVQMAKALSDYFISLGGTLQTNFPVHSLEQLPSAHAVLFDLTPAQILKIAGQRFSPFYRYQLRKYKYGMGVFKIDWALNAPIPFSNRSCREAGTVHLGNSIEEIAAAEEAVYMNQHPEKPFVLLAQQSIFDPSRTPEGKHSAWAYCHVPNGSDLDMTLAIERQVERFAPGFRDTIIARHTTNAAELETYNSNYIGGDINGGSMDITQLFTRPALRNSPYKTSARGIYICSASTPPGGGVHGMCGFHAARKVLSEIFSIRLHE